MENRLRWLRLETDTLRDLGTHDDLAIAVRDFRPLEFEGGWAASNWLERCLEERTVPLETHLVTDDAQRLLGFYVIRPAAFTLSEEDRILLGLRRRVKEQAQPGALIELIARSRDTERGFGSALILHALGSAIANEAVALLVETNTDAAQKVWRRHRFMPFKPEQAGPGTSVRLWHPVDEPRGGTWPS